MLHRMGTLKFEMLEAHVEIFREPLPCIQVSYRIYVKRNLAYVENPLSLSIYLLTNKRSEKDLEIAHCSFSSVSSNATSGHTQRFLHRERFDSRLPHLHENL